DEIETIDEVFKRRMDEMLAIAAKNEIEILILGAWGCGVFRNEPKEVAQLFKEIISEKYSGAFQKIVFAVYDTSEKKLNFKVFEDIFS
ncbi:MAG: TIGR02452 family protein, partial [Flavobacterium sp.]|nr:TIGR02452 family protein [Flavobacterium sp.]